MNERQSLENRAQGGLFLALGGLFGYFGIKENLPIEIVGGAIVAAEGASDLITGYSQYLIRQVVGWIGYLIERLKR